MADFSDNPPWLTDQTTDQNAAPPTATPNTPDIPPWQLAPSAPKPDNSGPVVPNGTPKTDTTNNDSFFGTNTGTAVARMLPTIAALPRSLSDFAGSVFSLASPSVDPNSGYGKFLKKTEGPGSSSVPDNPINLWPTADTLTKGEYAAGNALTNSNVQPYQPTTTGGKIYQDALSGAPAALIGGGGLLGMFARQAANLGGTAAADTTNDLFPNHPVLSTIAGLLGSLAGDRIPTGAAGTVKGAANIANKVIGTDNAVNNAAKANLMSNATAATGNDVVNTINTNLPNWQFTDQNGNPVGSQPKPTLGDVTQDTGINNLIYNDQAAAAKAGDTTYQTNAKDTNQAQREAVAGAADTAHPNLNQDITNQQQNLATQVQGLPTGVSAQDAGANFRSGLQSEYDARAAAQKAAGTPFDALATSNAKMDLNPVSDYAIGQAASIPGEVGGAYKAAAGQFKTATGIGPLDTAQFAQGTLKGLGDLAQSYPPGSSGQRAVLDVKSRAEQLIEQQEPAITAAREQYAKASQPLDIFDPKQNPGPIANSVQTTRFGGYTTPNDSVVSQFLTSKAGPDAIKNLNQVFGDPTAATGALQDYIASQVQAKAVNPDGSVNLKALQGTLAPYQPVLGQMPFAGLRQQFSTIAGAQDAVSTLQAKQKLFGDFTNGLGTMERDAQGNPMYSAAQFNKTLQNNRADVQTAYGTQGTAVLDQVNKQLTDAAQAAYAKVKGQSGTPQATQTKSVIGVLIADSLGAGTGAGIGAAVAGPLGSIVGGAAGTVIGTGIAARLERFNQRVTDVTRQALTDPVFAKSLLANYNPKLPSSAGQKAMNYVQNRLSGYAAPQMTTGSQY